MATGVVGTFDERAGWGTIVDDEGFERFFHAVAVADGTRTIAVGSRVEFDVVPGLLGRWEADSVRPSFSTH
jgi:cold shock CspA family protein